MVWISTTASVALLSVAVGMLLAQVLQAYSAQTRQALGDGSNAIGPVAGAVNTHDASSSNTSSVSSVAPLAANEQTEALAELTARISHDLRTPLNAVIGFSELMSRETFGPLGSSEYQDYANHIRESGQSLLRSAEDTLAITSALAGPVAEGERDFDVIFLHELISEAWERVELQTDVRDIELQCNAFAGVEVAGDRRSLRQALVNLLLEALRQSQDTGLILVDAVTQDRRIDLSVRVERSSGPSGCSVSLQISIARALLEFQGASIDLETRSCGAWVARVELEQVAQQQLFAA
ncbi:MAG: HAMP domain-containing sensor histidine kinase [Filomicrobium sp.]